jgi:hypothetical protein
MLHRKKSYQLKDHSFDAIVLSIVESGYFIIALSLLKSKIYGIA